MTKEPQASPFTPNRISTMVVSRDLREMRADALSPMFPRNATRLKRVHLRATQLDAREHRAVVLRHWPNVHQAQGSSL